MNAKPALVRPSFASDLDALAACWLSRICLKHTSALCTLNESIYSDDLRKLLGITPLSGDISRPELRSLLKKCVEAIGHAIPEQNVVLTNVRLLATLVDLDAVQIDITTFVTVALYHPLMVEVMDTLRLTSKETLIRFFAEVVGHSESDIRKAIRPDGHLLATRIVSIERNGLGRGMEFDMPTGLRNALLTHVDNVEALMAAFIEPSPKSQLDATAFAYLADETTLLQSYLTKTLKQRLQGVNILIYGPPGTGKTEYARWLSESLGRVLFQVRATGDEEEPITGKDRLAYFQLSQRFLQKSNALMLFDEIEDVFPQEGGIHIPFLNEGTPIGKMYLNRVLESNPVPAIWISNSVEHIDGAFLRRFAYSFEMGIPPASVREQIVDEHLKGLRISSKTRRYLVQQDQVSPAQIEKAARVMRLTTGSKSQREANLLRTLENSMALLGQEAVEQVRCLEDGAYSLDYLNPDCDLHRLVAQLKESPDAAGAICFYGPPGTGKTALAYYLARAIPKPLMLRHASDILSPYVGETEQRIAKLFREAREADALLLLDEADSFLRERSGAKNSWEVTATNEMLTQMEKFDGIFICSTNLIQHFDAASLRRFTLKIKFDYLTPAQRWQLFCAHVPRAATQADRWQSRVEQLRGLLPGDFATVRRQVALLNLRLTPDEWITRLAQECAAKRLPGQSTIGFVRS